MARAEHNHSWFSSDGDSFHFGANAPDFFSAPLSSTAPASITQAAPTQADEVAFISGVNSSGEVVAESFWTWRDGTYPASYAAASDAHKWGDMTAGTSGGTVKFYFDPQSHWAKAEKAVFKDCLTLWSDLANIRFKQTTNAAAAQITIVRGASGTGAYDSYNSHSSAGSGAVGGHTLSQMTASEVSIDTSEAGFGPISSSFTEYGGYPWDTVVHELGHAIGLGHGGPYNAGEKGTPDSAQYSPYDSRLWTLMSYIDPTDTDASYYHSYPVKGTNWGVEWQGRSGFYYVPTTPMALDIQAAQSLYGAPTKTALDGGQTFGFNCNVTGAAKVFYDFTVNTHPVVTLWDEGTGNKLDVSGFAANAKINLNPGKFSSCNGETNNICIAAGTRIDTVIGGSGYDKLTGNNYANVIKGGAGNDRITGGLGADKLTGGPGHDTFVYTKPAQSTGPHFDVVYGFDAAQDKFDLWFTVNKVHALDSGSLSKGSFNADMAGDLSGSKLAAHSAVLFTPSDGNEQGKTFLVVNPTGTAGYYAGEDLVILLHGGNLAHFGAANFI